MTPAAVEPTTSRPAPPLRLAFAGILLALLASFGVLASPAPADLAIATGLIEETQAAAPDGASVAVSAAATQSRRRRLVLPSVRRPTANRRALRSWPLPVRVVGGVPPGRAPPLVAARP